MSSAASNVDSLASVSDLWQVRFFPFGFHGIIRSKETVLNYRFKETGAIELKL